MMVMKSSQRGVMAQSDRLLELAVFLCPVEISAPAFPRNGREPVPYLGMGRVMCHIRTKPITIIADFQSGYCFPMTKKLLRLG